MYIFICVMVTNKAEIDHLTLTVMMQSHRTTETSCTLSTTAYYLVQTGKARYTDHMPYITVATP